MFSGGSKSHSKHNTFFATVEMRSPPPNLRQEEGSPENMPGITNCPNVSVYRIEYLAPARLTAVARLTVVRWV